MSANCTDHVNYTKWCVKCQAELAAFIRKIIPTDADRIKELFSKE